MGVVYHGVSQAAEQVAVKVILPGLLDEPHAKDRFAREVQALKTVNGPRVALLVDADPHAAEPWLAVHYVHGPDLDKFVRARGPLQPELVAILGAVLAEGLGAVHKAGLLHRDLKPHNILLGPDGPVIIDFGLAVLIERRQKLTTTGMRMGTLACMPPEQARAERRLTPAADVYGLGATLLFAATGRYPYDAPGEWPLLYKITDRDQQPDLDDVPESLRPVLTGMLQYDPSDRLNLDEVTTRLVRWLEHQGKTAVRARAQLVAVTTLASETMLPPQRDLPPAPPLRRRPGPPPRVAPATPASPESPESPESSIGPGTGRAAPPASPGTSPGSGRAGSGPSRDGHWDGTEHGVGNGHGAATVLGATGAGAPTPAESAEPAGSGEAAGSAGDAVSAEPAGSAGPVGAADADAGGEVTRVLPDRDAAAVVADRLRTAYARFRTLRRPGERLGTGSGRARSGRA